MTDTITELAKEFAATNITPADQTRKFIERFEAAYLQTAKLSGNGSVIQFDHGTHIATQERNAFNFLTKKWTLHAMGGHTYRTYNALDGVKDTTFKTVNFRSSKNEIISKIAQYLAASHIGNLGFKKALDVLDR